MEPHPGLKIWLTHCYALLGDLNGVLRSVKKAIDNRDPQLWHLSGYYSYNANIDGVKLGTTYDGKEVQELLRKIKFDQESLRRLKI